MRALNNLIRTTRVKKYLLSILFCFIFALAISVLLPAGKAAAQDTFGLEPVGRTVNLGGGDIRVTIGKIVRAVLGLLGVIAVVIILYGGYTYMTAGGNEEKITQAKKILINGVIGLAIILSALAITQFILSKLSEATKTGEPGTPVSCSDLDYAFAHPKECGDTFCIEFPQFCSCADKHFVVQSITPRTDNTGMNNVAIRVVLSKRILDIPAEDIGKFIDISRDGVTTTDKFEFKILGNVSPDKNSAIEAQYIGSETCADGAKCLSNGHYNVIVSPEIKDENGRGLEMNADCGDFTAEAIFEVKDAAVKIKDIESPRVTPIKIKFINSEGKEEEVKDSKLLRGESYFFSADIVDNSGAGYVNMLIEKQAAINNKIYGYYDGPSAKRGSDAPVTAPYLFSHRRFFPINSKALESYLATIKAVDIDNNFTIVTAAFIIVGEHCKNGAQDGDETGVDTGGSCGGADGDSCLTDLDCAYSHKCLDVWGNGKKVCKAFPRIEDVNPMDGAGGNWITVTGRYFGANLGKIAFGYDKNKNNVIDSDEWVEAEVVQCRPEAKKSWTDNWVIAAVPASMEKLPLNSTSSIRLTVDYNLMENEKEFKPTDSTADDWGPKPGAKDGWFTKNEEERPGLCLVAAAEKVYDSEGNLLADEGANSALVNSKIFAFGNAFGAKKGDNNLYFSLGKNIEGKDSAVKIVNESDWSDTRILARAPNLTFGWYGVYVLVKDKKSNKAPFEILNLKDIEAPVISNIDPSTTTPGSYITIFGSRFGDMTGEVYLSREIGGKVCDGCKLNPSLPSFCGDSWQDTQVIAEVPKDFPIGEQTDFYLTLKRGDNGLRTAGQDSVSVEKGMPLPSLCDLFPDSGPAPLPGDEKLNLFGINFSNKPSAHFWTEKAVLGSLNTWLAVPFERLKLIDLSEGKLSGQKIETVIPYFSDEYGGHTMQTGPIKVQSKEGKASNGLNYNVSDCGDADAVLQVAMDAKDLRCCETDGKDSGRWKSKTFACEGETRDAGYVWRFTTGIIPRLPYVLEQCDQANWDTTGEMPSPVPWENWKQGKQACLNSTISVNFSMPMDPATFTKSTVKLYKCKEDAKGGHNCGKLDKEQEIDIKNEVDVLEIHIPSPNLDANTWYHVELLAGDKGIKSLEEVNELGVENVRKQEQLSRTKPCDELGNNKDTAYCYDFKTGAGLCKLVGAGIKPADYLTHLLGVLQDTRYPLDLTDLFNPAHPYYYYVWGKGSQECSILNVDGLGWDWGSSESAWATAEKVSNEDYINSQGLVTAWANTAPKTVDITATAPSQEENGETKLITAASILTIDLTKPHVVDYWPNCEEACVNSAIGVRFNQLMMEDTYEDGINVYKCGDELCEKKEAAGLNFNIESDAKEPMFVVRAVPNLGEGFEPGAWYLVKITGDIKAVGAFKPDGTKIEGKGVEAFAWRFRTKDNGTPCMAEKIDIIPSPFVAHLIGQKNLYSAMPKGAADQCSPDGQELNPWWFGWSWDIADKNVAVISKFASTKSNKPFCTLTCLFQGSDVGREQAVPYLCGNRLVEPGEDCDIAAADEVAGETCGYNCLRPNKTNTGSSTNPPSGQPDVSWCGSGSVTAGEDCDIKITTSSVPKEPWKSQIGCSSKCLHLGTQLSREWCDAEDPEGKIISACKSAVSVCGNEKIENGEECEVGINDAAKDTCDNKCLLKNVCDDVPGITGLEQCEKGKEGCRDDCTWIGSSLGYGEPSLCGDGIPGAGENVDCETDTLPASKSIQSPVQIATAIGLGAVSQDYNGKLSQFTNVNAIMTDYIAKDKEGNIVYKALTDKEGGTKEGKGDYYLQCGFTEQATSTSTYHYGDNDCPNNSVLNYGVGANSCCYLRPKRVTEYPVDGAGISAKSEPVCPNTFIEVKFNKEIDAKSLENNILLIAGYEDAEKVADCASTTDKNDATDLVKNSFGKMNNPPLPPFSFWEKIWQFIKHFFVRLLGLDNVYATVFDYKATDYSKWCAGGVKLRPEVSYEWNEDKTAVISTVKLYIDNVLLPNRLYAVVLKGGLKGIKDVRGVGIKNRRLSGYWMNDVWLFKTGKEICKLKSITVEPDSYLFNKPFSSYTFQAAANSANNQRIVTSTAYDWEWKWAPAGHPVFDIPVPNTPADADTAVLGAKNVEGGVIAVAQAIVTADLSESDNHVGKVFTGMTELTAMFCENPWPAKQEDNKWAPFKDLDFNFSMSYCADAGRSGATIDDLPYLSLPPEIFEKMTDEKQNPSLPENILRRYLMFNDINDDVAGVQIFQNPDRLSASDWYKEKFPGSLSKMQNGSGINYDAVSDGKNYYINAQNVVIDKKGDYVLWNNIYQFSLNQGAQADSGKVLEQLLKSLRFNINLNDFGYCLKDVFPSGELPKSESERAVINDKYPCSTDFECRNPDGSILDGANGVCSIARTKFFRDLSRLQDIHVIQDKLDKHFDKNFNTINFKGGLKGGTYIPGYTVSVWPSWNQTLGAVVKGLPLEKINAWTNCSDPKAEKQTCWNAASSTYSCPAFSQVYEYEYVSSTKSYMLHGPLEFLSKSNNIVEDTINIDNFTTEPKCQSEVWSPYGEKCGDGILQPNKGELCEPPGSMKLGTVGDIPAVSGKCEFRQDALCSQSAADCGYYGPTETAGPLASKTKIKFFSPQKGYCVKLQNNAGLAGANLAIASEAEKSKNIYQLFGCQKDDDCRQMALYQSNFEIGLHSDNSAFTWVKKFNRAEFAAELKSNSNDFICAHTGKCRYTREDCGRSACVEIRGGFDNSCDFAVLQPQNCLVKKEGEEDVNCVDYFKESKASWLCNSFCQWEKGICKSLTNCGNGIVEGIVEEGGEACDDGAKLNGTYGHCNQKCDGLYNQRCGDGNIDTDAAGHPLELCEKVDEQQIVFRTADNPPKGVRLVCNDYLRDTDVAGLLEKMCGEELGCKLFLGLIFSPIAAISNSCREFTRHCQADYGLLCNTNDDCQHAPPATAYFELNENNAKDLAASFVETEKDYGKCVAPQYGPVYTYNKHKELSCSWDCQNYGSYCGDKRVDYDYGEECDDGNDNDTDTCHNNCIWNIAPQEKEKPPEYKACGDGEIDKDQGEVCDTGKKLGEICTPEYGKSCAYCSLDCKKVLTVDATAYCGNKKIDITRLEGNTSILEACDMRDNQVVTGKKEEFANCEDKGSYKCENDCTILNNDCTVCDNLPFDKGGVIPRLKVINPVNGTNFWWGLETDEDKKMVGNYAYLYRFNPPGFVFGVFAKWLNAGASGVSDIPGKAPPEWNSFDERSAFAVQSSPVCNGEYKIYFNTKQLIEFKSNVNYEKGIDAVNLYSFVDYPKLGDFFDFPVNGEYSKTPYKEMIVSPPVLPGQFRVVLRWAKEEDNLGADFGLRVKNDFINSGLPIGFADAYGNWCLSERLEEDCRFKNFDGVYVHNEQEGEMIHTQAITIDTNKKKLGNYQIFAENLTNGNMYDYRKSNLQVEVYGFHSGQDDLYSIFGPMVTFTLKMVDSKDSSPDAHYWQIFNLVKNAKGEYKVAILPKEFPKGTKIGEYPNGALITDELDLIDSPFTGSTDEVPGGYKEIGKVRYQVNDFLAGPAPYKLPVDEAMSMLAGEWPSDWTDYSSPIDWELKVEKETVASQQSGGATKFISSYKCIDSIIVKVCYKKLIVKDSVYLEASDKEKTLLQVLDFNRLEDNTVYRYIWYKENSDGEGSIYKEIENAQDIKRQVYLGLQPIYLGVSENEVTASTLPYLLRLAILDYNDIKDNRLSENDTQWYTYALKRIGKNIYIDLVDKFLPSDVSLGKYENYD